MIMQSDWKPSLEECTELLGALVSMDTCQPDGNEEKIVDWIIQRLPDGVSYTKLRHSAGRASLIVKAKGQSEKGGAAFIGHLDTVACSHVSDWKYPPHQAEVTGNIMYGRGTADMKGGVAAMLLVMNKLCREKSLLKKPVYFCFTADEENQGTGIQAIAKERYLDEVEEVVICEPSDGQISICEKGALWVSLSVEGKPSHASRPDLGINAIEAAYTYAEQVKSYIKELPEHMILGKASASVTKFDGGIMTNIIPADARLEMDIRTVPGISHEDVLHQMEIIQKVLEEKSPGIRFQTEVLNDRPAVGTEKDNEYVKRMLKLSKDMGMNFQPRGTHFYTDGSQLIPGLSVPFVIAGPGDDKQAHCMDEHVDLGSVAQFAGLYYKYITENYEEI